MSDAEEALRQYGHPTGDGRWWFTSPHAAHSEVQALAIVESCLLLDMPVTDVLTSQTWLRLVDRVASLQERIDRLEAR